nr:putative reverse transcriptase, RNA-dependent DNA polymerase, Gag-polypeptide of LTR copia-type [Tanacetum cinerariifolium]
MATRFLYASVPKTNPTTKQSQHRTPFSAVATSRLLHISRLEASKILETIYEDEINVGNEGIKEVAASFLLSNRSTCLGQMPKHLSKNSDKFQCAQRSWLTTAMEKDIRSSVKHANTASEIWSDLRERFGKKSAPRAYKLKQRLSKTHQSGISVSTYYTKLRGPWDENKSVLPASGCTCNKSSCEMGKKMNELREKEKLYQFLMGLDADFAIVTKFVSSLNPVFLVVKKAPPESAAFKAFKPVRRENNVSQNKNVPKYQKRGDTEEKCTECGRIGHTRYGCFKIIGYPEWWPGKVKPRGDAHVETKASLMPGLTKEQYHSFLKHFAENDVKDDSVQMANMAGKKGWDNDWVVDSGFTEHITHDEIILNNKIVCSNEEPVVIPNGDAIHKLHTRSLIGAGKCREGLYRMGLLNDDRRAMMTTENTWQKKETNKNSMVNEPNELDGTNDTDEHNVNPTLNENEAEDILSETLSPPEDTTENYSIFIFKKDACFVEALIYVDDVLMVGNDIKKIQHTKEELDKCFSIKDLRVIKYFLGIEVAHTPERLVLSQRKYILNILEDCGFEGCRPSPFPFKQNLILDKRDKEPKVDAGRYRRLVGRLLYLKSTRPDIAYSINVLSQFMADPRHSHMDEAHQVLRCPITRRSRTGYLLFRGSPISWKTKKQNVVSRSSAEAEYKSMASTVRKIIWMLWLLKELTINLNEPTSLFCDNQAARHIANNPVFHERTKHAEMMVTTASYDASSCTSSLHSSGTSSISIKTSRDSESTCKIIARFELDIAFICERLTNLNLLSMHIETRKSHFEPLMSDMDPNLVVKALEYDLLAGVFCSEVRLLETHIAETTLENFYEAYHSSEVLMESSNEVLSRIKILHFNLKGSVHREIEFKSNLLKL